MSNMVVVGPFITTRGVGLLTLAAGVLMHYVSAKRLRDA
jgi:hypothetical protein